MESMICIIKKLISVLKLFFLMIVLAVGFKVLIFTIPCERINKNIEQDADFFLYPNVRNDYNYKSLITGFELGGQLDYWTEGYYLNVAYGHGVNNPIYSALANEIVTKDGAHGGIEALNTIYTNSYDSTWSSKNYWWGIVDLLRPLLYFFSYRQIMHYLVVINLITFIISCYMVICRFGKKVMLIYGMSFCLVAGYNSFFLLCTMSPTLIAILAVIWLCKKKYVNICIIFNMYLIIGFITAYFDWMSTPIVSYTIPTIFVILLLENGFFNCILKSALGWSCGYGGSIVSKWILNELILHDGSLLSGIEHISDDMTKNNIEHPDNYFLYVAKSIKLNFSHLEVINLLKGSHLDLFIAVLGVCVVIIFIICLYKYKEKELMLMLVSMSPIVWDVVLKGHVYVHHWFTYRNLWGFFCGLFLVLVLLINRGNMSGEYKFENEKGH